MTAYPFSARRRPMARASSYIGSSARVRADPKTVTAGPTLAIASKPSTNSDWIRRVRHGSVSSHSRARSALEELLVLGRAEAAPSSSRCGLGRHPHPAGPPGRRRDLVHRSRMPSGRCRCALAGSSPRCSSLVGAVWIAQGLGLSPTSGFMDGDVALGDHRRRPGAGRAGRRLDRLQGPLARLSQAGPGRLGRR